MTSIQNLRLPDGSMSADTTVAWAAGEYRGDVSLSFLQNLTDHYWSQWSMSGFGSKAFPYDHWSYDTLLARLKFGSGPHLFPNSTTFSVNVSDNSETRVPDQQNTYTVRWHYPLENPRLWEDYGDIREQVPVYLRGSGIATTAMHVQWSTYPALWCAGQFGAILMAVTFTPYWEWNVLAGVAGITLSAVGTIGNNDEYVDFTAVWNTSGSTWDGHNVKPNDDQMTKYRMVPTLNIVYAHKRWMCDFYGANGFIKEDFATTKVMDRTYFTANFIKYIQ